VNGSKIENSKEIIRKILPNKLIQTAFGPARKQFLTLAYKRSDFQFIHVNKCGGTSVERALGLPFLNHDLAIERQERVGKDKWNNNFTFTVCRNPYDRMESIFFYQNRFKNIPVSDYQSEFEQYLKQISQSNYPLGKPKMFKSQAYWISDSANNKVLVNGALPLERIQEGWPILKGKVPKAGDLEHLKSRVQKSKNRAIYTQTSIKFVKEIYSIDFELFGYSKDFNASKAPEKVFIEFS